MTDKPGFDRLEELLDQAIALPSADRSDFLDQACGNQPGLKHEIEQLLAALEKGGDYFDHLAEMISDTAALEIDTVLRPRITIGPYRTLRALGHGGMGVVYLAERIDGEFDQHVAVKLLHLDRQRPALQARFLLERQLLARLSHPNIARLIDGGFTDEGRPYFVMEYVRGRPLTEHCRERELELDQRLDLFLELVGAVGYLHRNLVVHRDLKPSNILVDDEGRVRLLDFGIAKLLEEGDDDGARTLTSERLLTPAYAAPEQASGENITTATDVYSLGVVLWELLTDARYWDPESRRGRAASPSTRLRTRDVSEDETEPPIPWRRVAGDLDRICRKALRPEPERRYESASRLGEDIERFRRGLPVTARPSTFGYRLRKWVGRHRWETATGLALLILLTFGFLRERSLRDTAERARQTAQVESRRASAVSDFLEELLSSVDPRRAQGNDVSVADVLDDAAARLEDEHPLVGYPAAEADVRLILGETYRSLRRWPEAEAQLMRALALRGGPDADTLEALEVVEALGVLAYRSGRYEDAEAPLERVALARTDRLGPAHPDTLDTMRHLANLYWYQDRLDEAEALDRRTLEACERSLGPDHPDTNQARNGLAATLFARARFAEAADLFALALEGQRRALGDDHPDTLRIVNNLSAAYAESGRYLEAEPLQREVLADRERVLGPDHPTTILSRSNLGITLLMLARYPEAEEILLETQKLRQHNESRAGPLHTRVFLARLYAETGRLDRAEDLYRSTLVELTADQGEGHSDTRRAALGLALVEQDQGRLQEAAARLRRLVETSTEAAGPEHPDTLGTRVALSQVLLDLGWQDEAAAEAKAVETLATQVLEPSSPTLEAARIQLARTLIAEGHEGAEPLARLVLEARQRRLGPEHPLAREAEAALAQADAPST